MTNGVVTATWNLVKGLACKRHQVLLVTPYLGKENTFNYKDITHLTCWEVPAIFNTHFSEPDYLKNVGMNNRAGWARKNRQMLICGHTHCFRAAVTNAVPYFNTGSCLVPDLLSGFEIIKGKISQIKWTLNKQHRWVQ